MDFSFIIPVYNGQARLQICIDSVLKLGNNLPFSYEIILIDDGSSDESAKLMDSLASSEIGVFSVHECNHGVSFARNTGIKLSEGQYIIFVDSDDSISYDRMLDSINTIKSDNSIDMMIYGISFDYYSLNKLYRTDEMRPPYEGRKTLQECKTDIDTLFDCNCLSPIWNKIIHRRILDDTFFREDMFLLEDLEYSLRLFSNCKIVYFYSDIVYRYYQADNSGSRIRRINQASEITDKVEKVLKDLGCNKTHILDSITSWIKQEKLNSMSLTEIKRIYPDKFYKEMICRPYRKTRHVVAKWIKQHFGDFRKW